MTVQQDLAAAMEQSLRTAMTSVSDALRVADYGVPGTDLPTWIPWVPGFTTNPAVTVQAGPDKIAAAGCFRPPVARLLADTALGATVLNVAIEPGGALDTGTQRLLLIGGAENAHVVAVAGSTVTVDTNPKQPGNQGLKRAYRNGTIIQRVDVVSFDVATDATGVPHLPRDENQGAGPDAVVEGIDVFEIATVVAGRRYRMTLGARSTRADPVTGTILHRSLRADVTLRN